MAMTRISKDETLSFLLTYIVIERGCAISLDQLLLFRLTTLAQQAADRINSEEGVIPHEVIEEMAADLMKEIAP